MFSKAINEKIEAVYKKIKKDDEFEFMFFNYKKGENQMPYQTYLRIIEYLIHRSRVVKLDLEKYVTLDVSYSKKGVDGSFRISIDGLKSINKYMEMLHLRKNHVVYKTLVELLEKDPDITIIKKVKNKDDIIDIDDYDIRVRVSKEQQPSDEEIENLKQLDEIERNNIIFRFKQRLSLFVTKSGGAVVRIDLTNTQMSKTIGRIYKMPSIYELELEIMGKNEPKHLETAFRETGVILKIIQQSNYIIGKTKERDIISYYGDLLGSKKTNPTSLEGRKPVSLEVQHVVDKLPNRYAVTDKADGERYMLLINSDKKVYLISNNLHVKDTGLTITNEDYVNSILDGELIFLPEKNRHVFLAFDCLYKKNSDIRQENLFVNRLNILDDIIKNCFVKKEHTGFRRAYYEGDFNMGSIIKHYDKEMNQYLNALNHDIEIDKGHVLIRPKYFIPVVGGDDSEIFRYSEMMWNKYVKDGTLCPYILDGLMYHPLDQKYTTSKDSTYVEYKWKPPEKNSIDFYIQFEKNKESGQMLILYDNSVDEFVSGKPYKIANLYVGRVSRGIEQPVLFQADKNKYIAHLFLEDGEVRDQEGNILQDNTVVEFYYNNDLKMPEKHRWIPMKTRYDKTESVSRYQRNYGNYFDVANRIWRSIENPVLMSDITILGNNKTHRKHIDLLRSKIDHSIILSERQESAYFQKVSNLAKPMRHFHNFIKSNLIYTHCNKTYEGRSLSILDIACGQGADLMKFYYTEVASYVGIDIDNNGLISPVNGAISRYNKFRKAHPNFPKMAFVHADGGTILNYDDQKKVIGNMSDKNRLLMESFFSRDPKKRMTFDRINCQLAIHYFLANDTVWSNFLENINMYLKPGGELLVTTFDADLIVKLLQEKDHHVTHYTDKNGNQEVMFEIIKKYTDDDVKGRIKTGVAIDFHNGINFNEGRYVTEYLVQKDFIEAQMMERCNMELVDTDLFENQYYLHESYLKNFSRYEENEKTRKFLMSPIGFYDQTDSVNKASFELSRLNRYYVFRKLHSRIGKQVGGGEEFTINGFKNLVTDSFVVRRTNSNDFSFMCSIHDILQESGIVPKTVSVESFFNDVGIEMLNDKLLKKGKIHDVIKNVTVGHSYSYSESEDVDIVLNGFNLLILDDGTSSYSKIGVGKDGRIRKRDPIALLLKKDDRYYPIYEKKNDKYIGLFKNQFKGLAI